MCPGGGIGRHKGLKIPRLNGRPGSSPGPGTIRLYATRVYGEFRIFPPLFPPSVIAESKRSAEYSAIA